MSWRAEAHGEEAIGREGMRWVRTSELGRETVPRSGVSKQFDGQSFSSVTVMGLM